MAKRQSLTHETGHTHLPHIGLPWLERLGPSLQSVLGRSPHETTAQHCRCSCVRTSPQLFWDCKMHVIDVGIDSPTVLLRQQLTFGRNRPIIGRGRRYSETTDRRPLKVRIRRSIRNSFKRLRHIFSFITHKTEAASVIGSRRSGARIQSDCWRESIISHIDTHTHASSITVEGNRI